MKVFSFWASIEPYFLPVFHVFSWVYGVLLVNHWMTFLDDYKICTPTGKLEYFGENIWHEVKECHLNPNISEEAREFVERWDRWPLTFRVVISLFIYVVTLYATYNTVEYNWNCSPSKSIGHARVASILSEAFCFESIAILLISFFDVFVTNNTDGRPSAYSKVQCMNNIFLSVCTFYQSYMLILMITNHNTRVVGLDKYILVENDVTVYIRPVRDFLNYLTCRKYENLPVPTDVVPERAACT